MRVRLIPRRIKAKKFRRKWQELQRLCARQETWPEAIVAADQLLDEALKKKRMKGKSMGERLAHAQRILSDNDSVWYSHNLAKKVIESDQMKLRQNQVKKALVGFGRALKDLGALKDKTDEKL